GGSWFVESLTQKMVDGCFDYFDKIDGFGGMIEAVEAGFPQREIQESAYQYQKAVERGEQIIVGVNKYAMHDEIHKTDILQIDENVRVHQLERLEQTKKQRDSGAVTNALEKLKRAAQEGENTMPATIEAVKAYATVEEICVALRDVYGIYEEPAF
ncbi:MAG: methylmalonyl-CoA mutase family protein, partial [Acidobacteriota bacterium]|nr:methylmalonyl-CoA mutase family protein [Acidobacteriota bacterium]